jgi:hypothetical protein
MDWLQPHCSERSGAKCSIPHELHTDLGRNLHSCIYDLVKVAFRDGRGSGDWRVSEHADFHFQQRSISLQRIINATKSDKGFNSDKSFIDRILAGRVMHPHKPVVNHGERSNRTERRPDLDRQGRTPNNMDTTCINSRSECFLAGLRPRGLQRWLADPSELRGAHAAADRPMSPGLQM